MVNQEPSRTTRQVGAAPSIKEPGCGAVNPGGDQDQTSSSALPGCPQ